MIIDGHLDLAFNALRGRDLRQRASEQPTIDGEVATVSFPELREANVGQVFATIYCQPQTAKYAGYRTPEEAYAMAVAQLDQYDAWHREGLLNVDRHADGSPDAPRATLLLEGAEAIRTIDDLPTFLDRGVGIVGLAWQRTRYAGGTATPGGLTPMGRGLVAALDERHMIHDASHLAERAFWDLMHATNRLVIASHSNCRSIVGRDPNERHLTDAMIRAIAERGGVIGINFFDRFLLPADEYGKRRATLADVVAHVRHICDLTGSADHVALGTDLDGGLGRNEVPVEIETVARLGLVERALIDAGFTPADVEKVMSLNWARVIG